MINTGQIILTYPISWPSITGVGNIGGLPNSGSPVNTSSTGLYPTGVSTVAGGANYIAYAKVFFVHTGIPGTYESLSNPVIYITNESISDQITMSPDPYYLNIHAAQTGITTGRFVAPIDLSTGYFTGYSADNPLRLSNMGRGTITVSNGNYIGLWVKQTIVAGLSTSADNTFNIAIQGEIV